MAMRITTKMMQNTSIRNLNINKQRQEMLTNQMATGKKITRPSDDPVTAIRALKLNSSLDKIDQYYENNAKDAESWLELTDSAISSVVDILGGESGMRVLINQANNKYEEDSDITAIVKELVSLSEEIYTIGNASSAGRSLFTGYRTDLPLAFTKDMEKTYEITQQLTKLDMDKMTYVATGCLKELNEGNFNSAAMNTTEYDVTTNDIYRIRLAYENTDAAKLKTDENGNPVTDANGNNIYEPNVSFEFGNFKSEFGTVLYSANAVYDANGNKISRDIQVFENAEQAAYMAAVKDPDAVVYIAETGELLLGNNVKQTVAELDSDTEIRVSYEKTAWDKGDLNPVHYFYCECDHDTQNRKLVYNENFLDDPTAGGKQIIEYDIGNNQTIRVNTTADEIFTHDIGRDMQELQKMVEEDSTIKTNLEKITEMIDSEMYTGDDLERLELQKAALEKAQTYIGDKLKNRFSELLNIFDGYLEQVNVAGTNCGARGSRLELIQNRLGTQQSSYEELVSENEDADYSELTVQLASIKTTYEAALSSISYVMQTSLLDYIR